jgi:5-methylcytosine-specific restriction endonuclease McrA
MNDPEKILTILLEKEKEYIELNESIPEKLLYIFTKHQKWFPSCFKEHRNGIKNHAHPIIFSCEKCNCTITSLPYTLKELKTVVMHIKNKNFNFLCPNCEKMLQQEIKKEKKKKEENNIRILEENTKHYIENFLDPTKSWIKEIPHKKRWLILNLNYPQINERKITKYVKDMIYDDFLKTLYWKTIAGRIRYFAKFKCELCNKGKVILVVHHKTYKNHGKEHLFLEDLICLCESCHKKVHNIT